MPQLDHMTPAPASPTPDYDVIVIGAGPAGSAVATFLAREGQRVLIVERDKFPRFKVGESLIPATFSSLERLGVLDQLKTSPFPKKYSVQFYSQSGKASAPFYFSETETEEQAQTWQVLRSEFDQMLLDNAKQSGVEVQTGVSVKQVLMDGDRAVGVRIQNGTMKNLSSRLVIDASGQRAILARQLKIQRQDPRLKMAAVFTHFENAHRDEGIDEGATLILHTKNKDSWFWYIPLPDNRVSVGVVGPIEHMIHDRQGNPQQIFDDELAHCPGLIPRLENARQTMDMKVLNDFSYSATHAAGEGWMLVGDAFCFLDPIYSSGVLLALASAELAADTALAALKTNDLSAQRLGAYEPRMREGIRAFRHLVYAFYDKRFSFAGFLRRHPEHRDAVVKILVGDVFDRDFDTFFRDIEAFVAAAEMPEMPVPPIALANTTVEQAL